jgi:epsin
MSNIARATLRQAKNITKGYTDIQVKVREATSNDPWGPSGSQMGELADASYNTY